MKGIIIILGSPNDDQGNLSTMAMGRLAQGLLEWKRQKGYKILCTGGFGKHFNITDKPHAYYAVRYLIQKGIPKKDFLEIAKSRNTVEDAILSKLIAEKHGARTVIVVSSDFHMKRVQHIFDRIFRGYELIYSGTKTSFSKNRSRFLKEHEKRELDKLRRKGLPCLLS